MISLATAFYILEFLVVYYYAKIPKARIYDNGDVI